MAPVAYALGAFTTCLCAVLLLLAHRRVGQRLLLFSGLCFAGLTISNALVFIDLVIIPEVDLYPIRVITALASVGLLLYGLIWESY